MLNIFFISISQSSLLYPIPLYPGPLPLPYPFEKKKGRGGDPFFFTKGRKKKGVGVWGIGV